MGSKAILYISSFLLPIIGFLIFIIWFSGASEEKRKIAKVSLYISAITLSLWIVIGIVSFFSVPSDAMTKLSF